MTRKLVVSLVVGALSRFPTPEQAEADPSICRNQREVELLLLCRSLPDHLKPEVLIFLQSLTRDGVAFGPAAVSFLEVCGLSRQAAARRVRLVLAGV